MIVGESIVAPVIPYHIVRHRLDPSLGERRRARLARGLAAEILVGNLPKPLKLRRK